MFASTGLDQAILISGGVVVLTIILWIVRLALPHCLPSKGLVALRGVARVVRSWSSSAEVDEMAVIAKKKCTDQLMDNFRRICQILCVFLLPFIVLCITNIATGTARVSSPAQEMMLIVLQGVLGLILIFPYILSRQIMMDALYTFCMVVCAIYVHPYLCDGRMWIEALMITNLNHLIFTVVRREMYIVLPLTLLYGASATSSIYTYGGTCVLRPDFLVFAQWAFVVTLLGFTHLLDKNCRAVIYQGLEMMATKEVLAAASAMLRSCCDVVVELDSEGVIISPAMDLGSFLLRGPGRCLQGYRLTDLMSLEEDRNSLMDKLRMPKNSDMCLAEAIHVRMKDGNDSILNLQLLWFQFTHFDSQSHYMVGVRDFPTPSMAATAASNSENRLLPPEDDDVVSSSSETTLPLLKVDTTRVGFPILSCSNCFCARVGRIPRLTLLIDIVKSKEEFTLWVQQATNAILHRSQYPGDCRVVLTVPQGQVKAVCRILIDEGGQNSQQEAEEEGPKQDEDSVIAEIFDNALKEEEEGEEEAEAEDGMDTELIDPTEVRILFYNITVKKTSSRSTASLSAAFNKSPLRPSMLGGARGVIMNL